MSHSPTAEQEAIINTAMQTTTSIMINAYAGCGKSSTLELLAKALPPTPMLALAFNVAIKKELEARFPANVTIKTLNGLGHAAWGGAIGKRCEVDDRKVGKLVTDLAKGEGLRLSTEAWNSVKSLVDSARQAGLVPSIFLQKGLVPDTPETWQELNSGLFPECEYPDLARAVLCQSIKLAMAGKIDYDDQIYMSCLFDGSFPRFSLILVDEAQDLSTLNHIMVKRCAGPTGRLIVVGDRKQAIYAFRGADSSSMDSLKALRPEWMELPLTTTFRCAKSIVARQQEHAPGYNAFATNPEGEILSWWKEEDPSWDWEAVKEATPKGHTAVLCRNNAPLLSLAFKLIRAGVGCHMRGREIGKGLVSLSKKIIKDDSTPRETCLALVDEWISRETRLAQANGKEPKVAAVTDRGECLLAVLEHPSVDTAGSLRRALESLFAKDTGVTLSTIHKAKGLEWETVVVLDPWRIPSKFAQRAASLGDTRQIEQEYNLRYVAETRAKRTLILANKGDFVEGGE
jgi:hypothetical protein